MPQMVTIRPEVLVWARRSCGLSPTQAAQLFGVPVEELASWEHDGHDFPISKLREVSRKYKRPIMALVRSVVPPLPDPPEDFRTRPGLTPALTPLAHLAVRDATRIRDIATELVTYDRTLFGPPTVPEADWQTDNPTEVALLERQALGVTFREQLRWASANEAFNAWRARIQARGVLVLVKPMDESDCSGFSLYRPNHVPVIVANQKEIDQAKIFTLAHEYAHLMIRRGGICLEDEEAKTEHGRVETWANAFAGTLIAPERDVQISIASRQIDQNLVYSIAHRLKVSRPVVAIRLRNLGLVPQTFVDTFLGTRGDTWRAKPVPEVQDEEVEQDDGFGRPQEEIRLSEVGFAFPKIVLGAMNHELITMQEACNFLNIRADVLGPLQTRILAVEQRYT